MGIFRSATTAVAPPVLQWTANATDQFTFEPSTSWNVTEWKVKTGKANSFTNRVTNVYPTYDSTINGVVFGMSSDENLALKGPPAVNLFNEASVYVVFQLNAFSSWAYGHLFVQESSGGSQTCRIYCDWGSTSNLVCQTSGCTLPSCMSANGKTMAQDRTYAIGSRVYFEVEQICPGQNDI